MTTKHCLGEYIIPHVIESGDQTNAQGSLAHPKRIMGAGDYVQSRREHQLLEIEMEKSVTVYCYFWVFINRMELCKYECSTASTCLSKQPDTVSCSKDTSHMK